MKSKFTSLILLAIMLFSMLTMTACGNQGVDPTEGIAQPLTITLCSIRGEGTTDEAIAQVEKALNRISRAEYNTTVKLVLFTEEEYDAKLAERMAAAEEESKANITIGAGGRPVIGTTTKPKEYETTEVDGFVEYIYPNPTAGQLDIFLIRDQATYLEYVQAGKLKDLSSALSYDFASMAKYINRTLMNSIKINGAAYAIPNNHNIGAYTYLILNKDVVDELGYDAQTMKSLYDLRAYLADVKAKKPSYVPLYNCADPLVAYLDNDTMIGTVLDGDMYLDNVLPKVLLTEKEYAQHLAAKQAYEELGYITYGAFDGSQNCGAAFVTGLPTTIDTMYGEDYYTIPYSEPIATPADLFSSMYAVSTYGQDTKRCMEVISLLTTNEEFRNIFQYGVEGVHYNIDDDDNMVTPISTDYNMNALYTGNSYLLYPNVNMNATELDMMAEKTYAQVKEILGDALTDAEWVGSRSQALAKCLNNAARTSPYFGFSIDYTIYTTLGEQMESFKTIVNDGLTQVKSKTFEKYVQTHADATVSDYVEYLAQQYSDYGTVWANNVAVKQILAADSDVSAAGMFNKWYSKQYPDLVTRPEETPVAPEGGEGETEGDTEPEQTPAA